MKPTITTIETISGTLVDLANPKPEDFHLADIAWALSREPRFGAHTIGAEPYSVGQHTMEVAKFTLGAFNRDSFLYDSALNFLTEHNHKSSIHLLQHFQDKNWVARIALHHDDSEAYLRDLPSPVKNLPGLKESYAAVEASIMKQIFKSLNVGQGYDDKDVAAAWAIVHWADLYARAIEAYHLMPSRGAFWGSKMPVSKIAVDQFIWPRLKMDVYGDFLDWDEELSNK